MKHKTNKIVGIVLTTCLFLAGFSSETLAASDPEGHLRQREIPLSLEHILGEYKENNSVLEKLNPVKMDQVETRIENLRDAVDNLDSAKRILEEDLEAMGTKTFEFENNLPEEESDIQCSATLIEEGQSLFNQIDIIEVSVGIEHTLALASDGTVWSLGNNDYGQLGNGYDIQTQQIVQVIGLSNVVKIAAGWYHSLALKSDGTVWSWGNNEDGQLGDGTRINRYLPVQVYELSDITEIAGGRQHSLALKADGTIKSWGSNDYGQLGSGTSASQNFPIQVGSIEDVTIISAGSVCNLAVQADGTLWFWGDPFFGAGGSLILSQMLPVQLQGIYDVIDISVGALNCLAVKEDGTVWEWGVTLENGVPVDFQLAPKQQDGLKNVIAVSAGYLHSLALKSDGTVWEWGSYFIPEVDGSMRLMKINKTPMQVASLNQVQSIEIGLSVSIARKVDGSFWIWGNSRNIITTQEPIQLSPRKAEQLGSGDMLAISVSETHQLVLKEDGTVWIWGAFYDDAYQVTPVQVNGLSNIIAIASGTYSSLALKEDGTVWEWEWEMPETGVLFNDNIRLIPIQVSGLANVISIASVLGYNVALKDDGTVWEWGMVLKNGELSYQSSPVQINGLTDITSIYNGYQFIIIISSDDDVWTLVPGTTPEELAIPGLKKGVMGENHTMLLIDDFVLMVGSNEYGQLGTDLDCELNIVLEDVIEIATGLNHCMALRGDGTLWTWGDNRNGQLGDGTSEIRSMPISVLENVSSIVASGDSSFAIKSDGTVWAWGNDDIDQLGLGLNSRYFSTPVKIFTGSSSEFLTSADSVVFEEDNYSTEIPYYGSKVLQMSAQALDNDGRIIMSNGFFNYTLDSEYTGVYINSQTGAITISSFAKPGKIKIVASMGQLSATTIVQLKIVNPKAIAAGRDKTFFIKEDKTLWGVGFNYTGALGGGTFDIQSRPAKVLSLDNAIQISSGYEHTLAIDESGALWAWGSNGYACFGNPEKTTPMQVDGQIDVRAVAAGTCFSLVVKNDGTVWTGGENNKGQLGNGTTIKHSFPAQVSGLNNAIKAAAGDTHSLVLKTDGTVWSWGGNDYGQLGDGTNTNRTTPVQVSGLTNIIAIAAGDQHSLALKSDGTVWSWGRNSFGQLGDGTYTKRTIPVQVNGLCGIAEISAGVDHSVALKLDGTVWSWGVNNYGQLGDGTTTGRLIPVQAKDLNDIKAISAGSNHSIALTGNGVLLAWGNNNYGQLRDGTQNSSSKPIRTLIGLEKSENSEALSISFVVNGYFVRIPSSGNATITASAQILDQNNSIVEGDISYALAEPYAGVSINDATGEVTISADAAEGTAEIIASAEDLAASVQLVLSKSDTSQTELKIDTVSGSQYDIAFSAREIQDFSGTQITLLYDAAVFELVDLCVFTSQKEMNIGAVYSSGLTFTKVTSGEISFTVDKTVPSGKQWSGVINIVRLKAKATTNSILQVT